MGIVYHTRRITFLQSDELMLKQFSTSLFLAYRLLKVVGDYYEQISNEQVESQIRAGAC